MIIWDYPVTQPFGYDPTYPLNNGNHRGEDRDAPIGTQIPVNGVVIGLVGTTGASTGPHLHVGKFSGATAVNPQGGGQFIDNAVVSATGENNMNGKYVKITGDGFTWVYLHLSEIKVKQGDKLTVEKINKGDVDNMWDWMYGKKPSQADYDAWVGKTFKEWAYGKAQPEFKILRSQQKPATVLKPGTYKVN